jgi:hypothetical protein
VSSWICERETLGSRARAPHTTHVHTRPVRRGEAAVTAAPHRTRTAMAVLQLAF